MGKKYAGIGSRITPIAMQAEMIRIGSALAKRGWLLRSGHAAGADIAFEGGCDRIEGAQKEIFLPWEGFNGSNSPLFIQSKEALTIAANEIRRWSILEQSVKKLFARNVQQILGDKCDEPVDLVICWTPKAYQRGGTAIAMQIAKRRGIPILNLARPESLEYLKGKLKI